MEKLHRQLLLATPSLVPLQEDQGKIKQQPWHKGNQTIGDRKPANNALEHVGRQGAPEQKIDRTDRQEAIAGQAQWKKIHPSDG